MTDSKKTVSRRQVLQGIGTGLAVASIPAIASAGKNAVAAATKKRRSRLPPGR